MFEILFGLISLSFPLFYILGIIYFFKLIGDNQTKRRITYLQKALQDLEGKDSNQTIDQLIHHYKDELTQLNAKPLPQPLVIPTQSQSQTITNIPATQTKHMAKEDQKSFWSVWYEQHSIDLLLYLGAFLIVASALTYVSFQWGNLSGTTKALLITLLTTAFFVFGLWFYKKPKIKEAGATFIAISALLIPFCGIAWYNFYFKFTEVDFGIIWLLTSLVSICMYVFLVFFIQGKFYSYISSIALFSITASLVQVGSLPTEYYLFSGMFSVFFLHATRILYTKFNQDEQLDQPIRNSAHMLAVLTIITALLFTLGESRTYAFHSSLIFMTGSIYFFFSYIHERSGSLLVFSECLLPLGVWLFLYGQYSDVESIFYLLILISLEFFLVAMKLVKKNFMQESIITSTMAIVLSVIVFIFALASKVEPIHLFRFACIPLILGIAVSFLQKRAVYLGVTTASLVITMNLLIMDILSLPTKPYLVVIYLLLAVCYYAFAVLTQKYKNFSRTFLLSSLFLFFLNFVLSFEDPYYFALTCLAWSIIFVSAAFDFLSPQLIYPSIASSLLFILTLLGMTPVLEKDYILLISAFFVVMYFVSKVVPDFVKKQYRASSFIGLIGTPLIFPSYSPRYDGINLFGDLPRLLSWYIATALFLFDYVITKYGTIAYTASAVMMYTFIKQLQFLKVEETQLYTLPLAVYFMTLAYIQRTHEKWTKRDILDYIGLAFLIFPTLSQAFDTNGALYALLMGTEGIILIWLGNSLLYKTYLYSGMGILALAVISQFYDYLFALPRWVITGGIGFGFLATAIYLLSKRK